jgi:hypothetical protein
MSSVGLGREVLVIGTVTLFRRDAEVWTSLRPDRVGLVPSHSSSLTVWIACVSPCWRLIDLAANAGCNTRLRPARHPTDAQPLHSLIEASLGWSRASVI